MSRGKLPKRPKLRLKNLKMPLMRNCRASCPTIRRKKLKEKKSWKKEMRWNSREPARASGLFPKVLSKKSPPKYSARESSAKNLRRWKREKTSMRNTAKKSCPLSTSLKLNSGRYLLTGKLQRGGVVSRAAKE